MGMKRVDTGTRATITVLVTGFGAFPGAPSNPSAAILGRLARHRSRLSRLGISLETALLPVVYDRIGPLLETTVAAMRPHAILHLGLAGRRRAVSVETRALNRANPLHPDAAGRRTAQSLLADGQPVFAATYPAHRVLAAIQAAGAPAKRSIDAGDYVCNATLYLTLAGRLASQAGFLHVPKLRNPGQPCRRTVSWRPTLEDLTQAVLAAILVVGQTSRLCRSLERGRPRPRR
jgi:pyroglutamyl-peptidase